MKITIINGTNRIGNRSLGVSRLALDTVSELGNESRLVTLDNFDSLFRGEYINLSNASERQKVDLENMLWADILLFVIPTYHHGIPSSLKNFLDIVGEVSVYEGKKIGLIAAGGGSDAVRQTAQVISGILDYFKINSYILPKDCLIQLDDIDKDKLEKYIKYCIDFTV